MQADTEQIKSLVRSKTDQISRLTTELGKAVFGQSKMIDRLLVSLLTGGHVLLEGVPGLAKTTAIKSLASALSVSFRRIQFTPDLLPADLVGTLIYVPTDGSFTTRRGPVFSNFVLADEINRAPAKVQSALLEAMQENQVTIGDESYPLPSPFFVMATQNPIDQEGTYPLPEAQVDRFMMKVTVTYPQVETERRILDAALNGAVAAPAPVLTPDDILDMQQVVRQIYTDDQLKNYILALVRATREPQTFNLSDLIPLIDYGASPRASICLAVCARAVAFLNGRGYVTPQDVKTIAADVLRHRIILTYEAEAEEISADDIIDRILSTVPVP